MATYYPPVGFHFSVEFQLSGVRQNDIRFQEVSGISADIEMESVRSGGENRFTYKLPKRTSYPELVLKRGLLIDTGILNWCRDAIEHFDIQPTTVIVKLLNENHEPLQTYNFVNAYPKKWSLSSFNAQENSLVIETLELVYQYFNIL